MPTPLPPGALSCRKYAERRGVSPMAVSTAIKANRLRASVLRDEAGLVIGISDPFLADREWEANSNMAKAPAATQDRAAQTVRENAAKLEAAGLAAPELQKWGDDSEAQGDAAAREKHWKANTAELTFREKAKELTLASAVETKIVDVFTSCKTRLLALPSRARQEMPELTLAQVEKLEDLTREVCRELSLEEPAGEPE